MNPVEAAAFDGGQVGERLRQRLQRATDIGVRESRQEVTQRDTVRRELLYATATTR